MSSQVGAINSVTALISRVFQQPKGDFVSFSIFIWLTFSNFLPSKSYNSLEKMLLMHI